MRSGRRLPPLNRWRGISQTRFYDDRKSASKAKARHLAGPPDFFRLGHRHPWLYREREASTESVPRNPRTHAPVLSEEAGQAPPHELNTNSFSVFNNPRGVRGQQPPGGIPTRRRESLRMRTAGGGAGGLPPASSKIRGGAPRVFLIDDEPGHPAAPPRPATTPQTCGGDASAVARGHGRGRGRRVGQQLWRLHNGRGEGRLYKKNSALYIASQHRCAAATEKSGGDGREPRTGQLAGARLGDFSLSCAGAGARPGRRTQTACGRRAGQRGCGGRVSGRSPAGGRQRRAQDGARHQLRKGIAHQEIMAPEGSAAWLKDRAAALATVEKMRSAGDAQLAREIDIALPHELDGRVQQVELVRGFVAEHFVSRGMVAEFALHDPVEARGDDRRNFHAHIMLTLRQATPEGLCGR